MTKLALIIYLQIVELLTWTSDHLLGENTWLHDQAHIVLYIIQVSMYFPCLHIPRRYGGWGGSLAAGLTWVEYSRFYSELIEWVLQAFTYSNQK